MTTGCPKRRRRSASSGRTCTGRSGSSPSSGALPTAGGFHDLAGAFMKRILAATLALVLACAPFSLLQGQAQLIGLITGTASGPAGPLVGVTVNVINQA